MVLQHLAAILLFSGPIFYLGLWMAIDPAGITGGYFDSSKLRRVVRMAGVALVLVAIAV